MYGIFTKTILATLKSCAEEQKQNREQTKTNSNSSFKQNNGQERTKNSDYEAEQSLHTHSKETFNRGKIGLIGNSQTNMWKGTRNPNNGSKRQLNAKNNNSCSSSVTFPLQRRIANKNLVFDKRDFLFPETPKRIREQIQLDDVAQYSVTDMRTADEISNFIAKLDGLNEGNIMITDATACVGGNTHSFCKKFQKVQAIEIDKIRYDMLVHNLELLECTNVICYHANYRELLSQLTQDIVFLDPPWGGPSYKEQEDVELFLGDIPLEEICESLKQRTKYIIIKAPLNLNYQKFKANISGNVQVFRQFRKMLLIVVDYYHLPKVVLQEQTTNGFKKNDNQTNMENNQNRKKEITASHDVHGNNEKPADNSDYDAIAKNAADHAKICYSDYIRNDYTYLSAYLAARPVAHHGIEAARTAAMAAYQRATADVNYASSYKDSGTAEAYLHAALVHDYYTVNTTDNADGADSTDGFDDGYGTENTDYTNDISGASTDDSFGRSNHTDTMDRATDDSVVINVHGSKSADTTIGDDNRNSDGMNSATDGNDCNGDKDAENADHTKDDNDTNRINGDKNDDSTNTVDGNNGADNTNGVIDIVHNHVEAACKVLLDDDDF